MAGAAPQAAVICCHPAVRYLQCRVRLVHSLSPKQPLDPMIGLHGKKDAGR
jgi:hypothetical protein